jgi:quercetin dioxygenase-like cupin family protein
VIAILHAPALVGVGVGLGVAISRLVSRTAAAGWLSLSKTLRWLQPRTPPFTAVNAYSLDWRRNQAHRDAVTYFMKPLFRDSRSGHGVQLVRYPAGQINPSHSHPVGHGMYVLQGSLVTHHGTFGPDTFVWFPPGEVMWHGAGPGEDLVILFMVNGNLSTDYVRRESTSRRNQAQSE